MQLLYSAAHSRFALERVPLGGGGTIASWLEIEWGKTKPFPLRMLRPDLLGPGAPQEKDLIHYSEWAYARFCRRFEEAATTVILREDPRRTLVLCNDISEGPNFRRLTEAGFPVFTIFHVDVVDYFCRLYLRGWIRPEAAVRWVERWDRSALRVFFPRLLKLVFQKQADCVRYSRGLIVMSETMKTVLLRCYPDLAPAKILVLPWGLPEETVTAPALAAARRTLAEQYPTPLGSPVIVTLSRITPEKGQDRLLKALALWEKRDDYPDQGITYFLVGEAAYMQGRRFEKRLRRLAGRLTRTRVYFTGYLAGALKQAAFERGDLYVFPSRHESYGLTLLEALRAGLAVVATRTYGALDMVKPEFGALLPEAPDAEVPRLLQEAMAFLLSDRVRLARQRAAAQRFAQAQGFSDTAARLAAWLIHHTSK